MPAPGLSCSMQDLQSRNMRSSSLIRGLQIWAPCIGSRVLASGPPGKSLIFFFFRWVKEDLKQFSYKYLLKFYYNLVGKGRGPCRANQKLIFWWQLLLEKAMAPHSSALAWKIPRTEGLGRLRSMGSRRVGHGWTTSLSCFTFMHWRRQWQPTPVLLPGESQGRRGLVGCSPWGR